MGRNSACEYVCVNSFPVGYLISFKDTFPVGLKTFCYSYIHTVNGLKLVLEHETVTNVVLMEQD